MTNICLLCIRCGAAHAGAGLGTEGCSACAVREKAAAFATAYDYDEVRPAFTSALDGSLRGIGRYAALLPVEASELAAPDVGDTPLIELPRLAREVGIARLWLKDESRGPTWSFKDRASAVAAAHARSIGAPALVASSTGNAAAATVAHACRANLPAIILFAKNTDPIMTALVQSYGAHVMVTETKSDRWRFMRICVEEFGCYPNSNYSNPPVGNNPWAIDGYKSIGFEIWEQLGRRVPTNVLFPICYGDALFGVYKAFDELSAMGFTTSTPRLGGGEIYGSLETALHTNADTVSPGNNERPTSALSISAAQSTYQALQSVRKTGGWVSQLEEEELADAEKALAERAGIYVERAAAASLASLIRQRANGRIGTDAEVVLVSSSAGLKSVGLRLPVPEVVPVSDFEELKDNVRRVVDKTSTE